MKIKMLLVATVASLSFAACGEPDFAGAPDVRGLNLADARKTLEDAGYTPTVAETDAMFGVIVESNFAVCDQHDTTGHAVPVVVAKRGC